MFLNKLLPVLVIGAWSVSSTKTGVVNAADRPSEEVAVLEQQLDGHAGAVSSVGFSADGTMLASADAKSEIFVWQMGKPTTAYQRISGLFTFSHATTVSFDPKMANLLTFSDSELKEMSLLKDARQGDRNAQFKKITGRSMEYPPHWMCRALAFSADGSLLAIGFSTYNENRVVHAPLPAEYPPSLIVRRNERKLAIDESLASLAMKYGIRSMALNSNARFLAIGGVAPRRDGNAGFVVLAEITEDKVVQRSGPVFFEHSFVTRVSFSRDDQLLAVATAKPLGYRDGHVFIHDAKTLDSVAGFDCCPGQVLALSFSKDSKLIFVGGDDPDVHVISTDQWKQITILRGHKQWVTDIQLSPDGKYLASCGGGDNSVILWKLK